MVYEINRVGSIFAKDRYIWKRHSIIIRSNTNHEIVATYYIYQHSRIQRSQRPLLRSQRKWSPQVQPDRVPLLLLGHMRPVQVCCPLPAQSNRITLGIASAPTDPHYPHRNFPFVWSTLSRSLTFCYNSSTSVTNRSPTTRRSAIKHYSNIIHIVILLIREYIVYEFFY